MKRVYRKHAYRLSKPQKQKIARAQRLLMRIIRSDTDGWVKEQAVESYSIMKSLLNTVLYRAN